MKVVPQGFYRNASLEKVMVDGESCIIYKEVKMSDLQNQRYLSSHALTLVLNGGLIIETFEGAIRKIQKNQMIFLPKGLYMITDIIPDDHPFEAVVFFFDEELTDSFLNNLQEGNNCESTFPLVFKYNESLRLYVDTLMSLYRGKHRNQFTRAKLMELLHLVALSANGYLFTDTLFALRKKEKKSISKFMEKHFDKPLDIEDYAYLTGRSVSTFQRDFKRRFQISPKQWLIQKRLDKAAFILKETTQTVKQTMLAVGYENSSHFIKAFHKKFGVSPKQFQIKHRNKIKI